MPARGCGTISWFYRVCCCPSKRGLFRTREIKCSQVTTFLLCTGFVIICLLFINYIIVFMNVSMAEGSPVHECVESGLLQGEMTGITADFFPRQD